MGCNQRQYDQPLDPLQPYPGRDGDAGRTGADH